MIYETKVNEINPQAEQFLAEKMVVLFGEEAPVELKPFCYIIEKNDLSCDIKAGHTLFIDDEPFKIIGVGDVVNKNLKDLAHITLNFSGDENLDMAGTLYLEDKNIPDISVGSKLVIE